MKGVGMLVVSLRGVSFRFWCHLSCSGQNAIIFTRKILTIKSFLRRKLNETKRDSRFVSLQQ